MNVQGFSNNGPIDQIDVSGKVVWDSSCNPFFYSGDIAAALSIVSTARLKAHDMCSGNSCYWNRILSMHGLTTGMACCLKHMAGPSITVKCRTYWPCTLPNRPTGRAFPNANVIELCPGNMEPANIVKILANTLIHESVHICGKVGHDEPNDPYYWAPILDGSLSLPRPKPNDCCFAQETI